MGEVVEGLPVGEEMSGPYRTAMVSATAFAATEMKKIAEEARESMLPRWKDAAQKAIEAAASRGRRSIEIEVNPEIRSRLEGWLKASGFSVYGECNRPVLVVSW